MFQKTEQSAYYIGKCDASLVALTTFEIMTYTMTVEEMRTHLKKEKERLEQARIIWVERHENPGMWAGEAQKPVATIMQK